MKKLIISLCACSAIIIGCTTSQQTTTYKTLFSLEQTTTAAYDTYLALVVNGQIPTNGMPTIAHAYNTFHAASIVALDGVQYNTNALAPLNLLTESQDIINLIAVAKGGK